jgi:hypothetical protein
MQFLPPFGFKLPIFGYDFVARRLQTLFRYAHSSLLVSPACLRPSGFGRLKKLANL